MPSTVNDADFSKNVCQIHLILKSFDIGWVILNLSIILTQILRILPPCDVYQ